jgi:hypothetical protein
VATRVFVHNSIGTTGTAESGAKLYGYIRDTTTPQTFYTDAALTVPASNPFTADAAGHIKVYYSDALNWTFTVKSADLASTLLTVDVLAGVTSITYAALGNFDSFMEAAADLIAELDAAGIDSSWVVPLSTTYITPQPLDETLTALAGLTTAEGDVVEATGSNTFRVRKIQRQTYAALTAIAAANRFDDMLVYVASRATDGDGGEGWWRFDAASSATANGGTILAPDVSTGRWIRQGLKDGRVCLRWWGTDATALQAAFDYMETDSTISRLFIANGTYTIASTCTYSQTTLGRSITIEGENELETIISFTGTSGGCLVFVLGQTSAAQITNQLVVRQMSFTTAQANPGAAIKVTRTAAANVAPNTVFEDLYFYQTGAGHWTYAIWSIDASDTWFNRVYAMHFGDSTTACVFIDNNLTTQTVFGAYFYGCSFNGGDYNVRSTGQLESMYFTNCSLVGATDLISLDATGTTNGNPHLSIVGCHLNGKRRDVHTINWRAITITGTDVYAGVGTGDVSGDAILIDTAAHVAISGNKFEVGSVGVARTFISFTAVTDFSITGNVMHNATAAGITFAGATGRGVISGNTIEGYVDGTPNNEAIYSFGSVGEITYTGNKLSYFATGIQINSNNHVITGNTFSTMTTGVVVSGGTNILADNNVFSSVTTEYSGTLRRTIYREVTVNPSSIAAGARGTTVVTVPGSLLGDFVSFAAPYDTTDMQITAACFVNGSVGLYMKNDTGGAIDLASGTWKFRLQS